MDRQETLARLGRVIEESSAEEIDWSTVTEEATVESFGFDSLAVLDLIFDLKQEFGVRIPVEDMLKIQTAGELISYLHEHTS
jgi:acyl carrier protein